MKEQQFMAGEMNELVKKHASKDETKQSDGEIKTEEVKKTENGKSIPAIETKIGEYRQSLIDDFIACMGEQWTAYFMQDSIIKTVIHSELHPKSEIIVNAFYDLDRGIDKKKITIQELLDKNSFPGAQFYKLEDDQAQALQTLESAKKRKLLGEALAFSKEFQMIQNTYKEAESARYGSEHARSWISANTSASKAKRLESEADRLEKQNLKARYDFIEEISRIITQAQKK